MTQSPAQIAAQTSSPLIHELEETWSVPWLLADRVKRLPDKPLVAKRNAAGDGWDEVSARQFQSEVDALARGLVGLGLEAGQRVGIMAHTSYEWMLIDMAISRAGLVSVPIYETSSSEQIQWILTNAQVRLVFTENAKLAKLVYQASQEAKQQVSVFSLADEAIAKVNSAGENIDMDVVEQRTKALRIDDIYSIVYTSGTTGRPKGAVLTHRNAAGLPHNGVDWIPQVLRGEDVRLLLFLPLAHVYARFLQLLAIAGDGVVGHCANVKTLLPDLQSFRPTYLLCVPRVLEKVYNAADAKAGSGTKLKIFRWAAKVAITYSRALDQGGPSTSLKLAHRAADRLVYSTLRSMLGGNVRYVISGGGPLGERLGHFYRGVGMSVLEGYGLTETIGPATVNTAVQSKIGTVGPPVSGNSVRVTVDGDIEIKGIGVFAGYLNNDEANAEAFTADGWLRTGDIGSLDEDGYLRITGRRKELIITAGGKNVAPAILEDRLRGHPLVSQVVVVGDNQPFISALITLDADMLPQWLKNHGLEEMSVEQAAKNPEVLAALDRAVERTNEAVSRAESIRSFRVLTDDFTEANGLLTPSLKVKRAAALAKYADVVDSIYASKASSMPTD